MDIAKSIRMALAKEDKTQTWLAEQLGMHRSQICAYCRGRQVPGNKKIQQMANVFGMKVSEFYSLGEQ